MTPVLVGACSSVLTPTTFCLLSSSAGNSETGIVPTSNTAPLTRGPQKRFQSHGTGVYSPEIEQLESYPETQGPQKLGQKSKIQDGITQNFHPCIQHHNTG